MSYRKFVDGAGKNWDVRDRSHAEWIFEPGEDNPGGPRRITPPSYESDPFELTDQDLRRLLDKSTLTHPADGPRKSPFRD
ncbi:MAG: hypothetical protein ACREOJ_16815 [Gemmatimonadaceae bacterium]